MRYESSRTMLTSVSTTWLEQTTSQGVNHWDKLYHKSEVKL